MVVIYANRDKNKEIAIRLAEDGVGVCINGVEVNRTGIDELKF